MKKEAMLSPRFALALQFANQIHSSQTRKQNAHHQAKRIKVPYVSHLLAVCSYVLEYGGTEDQAIAALLHDAAEDQGGHPMLDSISLVFGDKVANLVEACTDSFETDPKKKEDWLPRKSNYLARLKLEPEEAKLVSCSDKLHNISNTLRDIAAEGATAWKQRMNQTGYDFSVNLIWYFSECLKALSSGWSNPILNEFANALVRLCELVGSEADLKTARQLRDACIASCNS